MRPVLLVGVALAVVFGCAPPEPEGYTKGDEQKAESPAPPTDAKPAEPKPGETPPSNLPSEPAPGAKPGG